MEIEIKISQRIYSMGVTRKIIVYEQRYHVYNLSTKIPNTPSTMDVAKNFIQRFHHKFFLPFLFLFQFLSQMKIFRFHLSTTDSKSS